MSLGNGGFGNVDLVEDDDGQQFARKTAGKIRVVAIPSADLLRQALRGELFEGGVFLPDFV